MRAPRVLCVALTCLLLWPVPRPAAADDPTTAALKQALAKQLVAAAKIARDTKLPATARATCDEALGLAKGYAAATKLCDSLTGADPADADRKVYDRRIASTGKKICKLYLRLFAAKPAKAKQADWDPYLLRALAWNAKTASKLFDATWRAAQTKGDWDRVQRLLDAGTRIAPDKQRAAVLKVAELKAAEKRPIRRTCRSHPIQYYLQLPKGWRAGRTWPLVVAVEGAGCNWLGCIRGFAKRRGDRPYILVTPITFLNTNDLQPKKYTYPQSLLDAVDAEGRKSRLPWDEAGLLAVLAEVRTDFGAEARHCMTGFSGGGLLTWHWVFHHPEQLVAAAPACPNFIPPFDAVKLSNADARTTLPVHVFQGDADPNLPALEQQWQGAKALAAQRGYTQVDREMLAGVKHSNCAAKVLDWFDTQRAAAHGR